MCVILACRCRSDIQQFVTVMSYVNVVSGRLQNAENVSSEEGPLFISFWDLRDHFSKMSTKTDNPRPSQR